MRVSRKQHLPRGPKRQRLLQKCLYSFLFEVIPKSSFPLAGSKNQRQLLELTRFLNCFDGTFFSTFFRRASLGSCYLSQLAFAFSHNVLLQRTTWEWVRHRGSSYFFQSPSSADAFLMFFKRSSIHPSTNYANGSINYKNELRVLSQTGSQFDTECKESRLTSTPSNSSYFTTLFSSFPVIDFYTIFKQFILGRLLINSPIEP